MIGWRILLISLPLALAAVRAPPAQADRTGSGGEREVIVVNHAPRAMNELYISPSSNGEWGADRLGEGTIAPGRSLRARIDHTDGCTFDLQVVYDDASREERHGVDLCRDRQVVFDGSGAVAPAGVKGGAHPVTVVNDAARPIQQVLISPADSGDWGDDLLGHDSLSVGERATLTYRGSCLADLRIVYDNRSAEERRDVDVCALHGVVVRPGWTTADRLVPLLLPLSVAGSAAPLTVSVANHAGHTARALFIYPEGGDQRGPDLLGGTRLDAGGQVAVVVMQPPGVCRFAAHVEYGGKLPGKDVRGVDLCRDPALVLPPVK